jgi:UDP-glucose-4-epimerase GalE
VRVLVTGGAGYIGGIVVARALAEGFDVRVLDDLSTGHRDFVPGGILVEGDCGDRDLLAAVLLRDRYDAVFHLAAKSLVGESFAAPQEYMRANVTATRALAEACVEFGVPYIVFSSSAAVYGDSGGSRLTEESPLAPVSPYGESKLLAERELEAVGRTGGLGCVALRFFNAAGASADGRLGEDHDPETHLVPRALNVALRRADALPIYGLDYSTPDGTCIRDYVHVEDIAEAHLLALKHLAGGGASGPMNLGGSEGHSVLEVVEACRRATGAPIPTAEGPRRKGDPPVLLASSERAESLLGWRGGRASLDEIVASAWRFHAARFRR